MARVLRLPYPVGGEGFVKKYIVALTDEEQGELLELTRKGECKARRLKRALVLLAADEGKLDRQIAAEVRVHGVTIERIRKRYVTEGLEAALAERPRPGAARKLDGHQEAMLVALCCSDPPEGRAKWTMPLLADRLVELTELESLSDETVRVALKRGVQALAEEAMVLPAGRRGVRGDYGGRAGVVRGAVRPEAPGGVL